jgi:hypothetical protein
MTPHFIITPRPPHNLFQIVAALSRSPIFFFISPFITSPFTLRALDVEHESPRYKGLLKDIKVQVFLAIEEGTVSSSQIADKSGQVVEVEYMSHHAASLDPASLRIS